MLKHAKKELNRSILIEDFGAKKELSGTKTELFGAKKCANKEKFCPRN